jgi:hypothetical protein
VQPNRRQLRRLGVPVTQASPAAHTHKSIAHTKILVVRDADSKNRRLQPDAWGARTARTTHCPWYDTGLLGADSAASKPIRIDVTMRWGGRSEEKRRGRLRDKRDIRLPALAAQQYLTLAG